jgi:hypothetical protein
LKSPFLRPKKAACCANKADGAKAACCAKTTADGAKAACCSKTTADGAKAASCSQVKTVADASCAQAKTVADASCSQVKTVADSSCSQVKTVADASCAQAKTVADASCAQMKTVADSSCSQMKTVADSSCSQMKTVADSSCSQMKTAKSADSAMLASEIAPAEEAMANMMANMSDEAKAKMAQGMERCAAYGAVTEFHKQLAMMEGTWDATVKVSMGPDSDQWMEMTGVSTFKSIMGGRHLKEKFEGTCPMGLPFEGMGIMGYDNVKQECYHIWIDNGTTGYVVSTGKAEMENGAHVMRGVRYDPFVGGDVQSREVATCDGNNLTVAMFVAPVGAPKGAENWWKMMEITYKRRQQ